MHGQAGLEYLMTYGWAILILVIVVAVILSSGIFSPDLIISEQCNFGTNMPCNLAIFNSNGISEVSLNLSNALPYKINITAATLSPANGVGTFITTNLPATVESGASLNLVFTEGGGVMAPKSMQKFSGTLTYKSCAPELGNDCNNPPHTITGNIVGRVIG